MTQITGGEISYERRVTTGDYQHKHLKVTLNFAVEEGQATSAIAEETLSRAIRLVEEGLRMKVGAPHPMGEADPLREAGMAAAINGMEFLKKWWLTVPVDQRNALKDYKDHKLKPMAEKADASIDNNLRAG